MRGILFIGLIILTIAGVVIPFIYKKTIKPRRMIRKLENLKITPGEFMIMYTNEVNNFYSKGKAILALWIWFFATSDGLNYFSSFDNLFDRSNIFILIILCMTLAVIADYTPGVICEYLFRDENMSVTDTKKKIIRGAIAAMTIVILSLITMLYILRFNIMDNVFDDGVSRAAMQSMTTIWATLVLGSSIASFLFTAINKTVLYPLRRKYISKVYVGYCDIYLSSAKAAISELSAMIEAYESDDPDVEDEMERIYKANVELIKKEDAMIRALYRVDKSKAVNYAKDTTKRKNVFKNEEHLSQNVS